MSSIKNATWLDNGANGGTELMIRRLLSSVSDDLLEDVQIHVSRLDEVLEGNKQVYWVHDLANDPMVGHLHETYKNWDAVVFVSHWQRQQFHNKFLFDWNKTHVIENAIDPLDETFKENGPVRFVYASMPNRGLDILVPVFEALSKNYDVELNVYSSFKLYNQEQNDSVFQSLFDRIDQNDSMFYHGTVPNDLMRAGMSNADCFVHPATNRPETSCLCLIEAMSAGLTCIHSSFGALPETSKGLTWMYDATTDVQTHANRLYQKMAHVCHLYETSGREFMRSQGKFQKQLIDAKHNTNAFSQKWSNLLRTL